MARAKKAAPRSKSKKSTVAPRKDKWNEARERREFQAGLRERLLEVFAASNIPERGRGSFLAAVTHRSKQATARWLQTGSGSGIPDAIALRQLSLAFNLDPAYLMGLSKLPRRAGAGAKRDEAASKARNTWLEAVDEEIARRGAGAQFLLMDSDEMEPTISLGALVFVNTKSTSVGSSGVYAIESAGRVTIRKVETRLGGGLVISCDNPRYSEQLKVTKEAELKRHSVRIVGRVEGWLDANWR
jgi:Peptidase S24-like